MRKNNRRTAPGIHAQAPRRTLVRGKTIHPSPFGGKRAKGTERTRKRNPRAMRRRTYQAENIYEAKPYRLGQTPGDTLVSNRSKKVDLMTVAKAAGWKGTTYHSAKKFERMLEWRRRERAAWVAEHLPGFGEAVA